MPPITRSGRRGGQRGVAYAQPQVQPQVQAPTQAEPIQEEAVNVQAVQQNMQAIVVPQPAVPVHAPPNVDQA